MPLFRAQHTCAAFALAIAVHLHAAPAQHSTSAAARQLSAAAAAAAVTSGPQQRSTSTPAAACLSSTEMSGNEPGRPERLEGLGDSSRISLEADATCQAQGSATLRCPPIPQWTTHPPTHAQVTWEAFAEVVTGLRCAVVCFWSVEARAAWPAELSPRCYRQRARERTRASFH